MRRFIPRPARIAAFGIASLLLPCIGAQSIPAERSAPAAGSAPTEQSLRALQDSVWSWRRAHPNDPLAENLCASSQLQHGIEVRLIRADSAARANFRLRVHDSPLIRIAGFDPDTMPWPPDPEGEAPPGVTMRTEYACYPPHTDRIELTVRNDGDRPILFGSEYTLCRYLNGRWETLPANGIWPSALYGLAPGGTLPFTARLLPKVYPARYGRYRICKRIRTENPRHDYLLRAEFSINPFVPFTRFGPSPHPCTY